MSVDAYLSRTWSPAYDCRAFARDVWKGETGEDVLLSPCDLRRFERLPAPVSPCFVLMRGKETHVGVYLRGRVLHLNEGGAHFQPIEIATAGYRDVRYYR